MRLIHLAVFGLALAVASPAPGFAKDNTTTSKALKTSKTKKLKGITGTTGGVAQPGVMELTSQECKGLGGKVTGAPADMNCPVSGEACMTTDKHGVVRAACIDEVAAD